MTIPEFQKALAATFPIEGPHTPESVEAAAGAVEELIRYLNHATIVRAPESLPYASNGYTVVGRLNTTLSQLFFQLSKWADELGEDPTLRHDNPEKDAAHCALLAAEDLRLAGKRADDVAHFLVSAQSELSPLWHDIPEEQA